MTICVLLVLFYCCNVCVFFFFKGVSFLISLRVNWRILWKFFFS